MSVLAGSRRAGLGAAVLASLVSFSGDICGSPVSRVEGTALGPPVQSVTALFEDRAGFLWVGSRDGLALYDGYSAVLFEHDVSEPSSLSDSYIRAIHEQSDGTMWIGTNSAGLERLDRATWTFRHFRHDSADPQSLPHDTVYAIVEDRDSRLWVGTQAGLARLDPSSGRFERFPAGSDGPGSDFVVALRVEGDGSLWIATATGGLIRRDAASGRFRRYRHDRADPGSIPGDGVYAVAADATGQLWFATNAGACVYDRAHDAFRSVPFAGSGAPSELVVTSVVVDAWGDVWATTLDAGLFRLRIAERGPEFVRRPFLTARSTDATGPIWSALADGAGNVWLGTAGDGLGRVPPADRVFQEVPRPSSPGQISALLVDAQARLWVGLPGGEVEILASGAPVRRFRLPATALRMVDSGSAVSIGTTDGLVRVDPRTFAFERFGEDREDPESLGAGWAWAVYEDRDGRLWVGTGEGGLNLETGTGTFDRFVNDPNDPGSLSGNYVTAILQDRGGVLWVGTRSGGLNALDESTRRFRRFVPDPGDDRTLSHDNVAAMLEDRAGNLWIGTAGGGVDLALRDTEGTVIGFDRLTERDGLISNNVVSLLEDDDGTIWIGTRKGISRLDPATRRVVSYGTGDGLVSTELSLGAAAAGPEALYFGTSAGLVAVRRGTPFPKLQPSPTVITAIRTVGTPGASERPVPVASTVEIPWGRILSFEFAVLDYGDRQRKGYAYRIDGKSDDWVDVGSTREITFTDLRPGVHALRVRGRNDKGVWSEIAEPIRIVVVPPFWMTLWFRGLALALLAGLALAGHHVRLSRLERRNRELMDLKDQRETALGEARASRDALHGAYDRLRRLTRRLEAAKEDERKHIAREIHDEMGQTLTTAKINLKLASGPGGDHERDRFVTDTIGLLDKMIGHVRALSLDLRPPLLDELGLTAALKGYVDALAKRTGQSIVLRIDTIPRGIPTEVEIAAFRVVQESLTNVLRHARAERVEVELGYDRECIDLRIRDDGSGFDVGSALERAATGEHLGILGMKERVESMGGAVDIESSPGAGTSVHARIPLQS